MSKTKTKLKKLERIEGLGEKLDEVQEKMLHYQKLLSQLNAEYKQSVKEILELIGKTPQKSRIVTPNKNV